MRTRAVPRTSYLLALILAAVTLASPALAAQSPKVEPRADDTRSAETPLFDYRAAARSAIDDAAESAAKIPDGADSAVALARVGDVAWPVDESFARRLFERALALAIDEAGKDGVRGAAGRAARERVTKLYAKRDFDVAIKRVATGEGDNAAEGESAENARSRAKLLAEIGQSIAASDPAQARALAAQSLATGYVNDELCQLIAALAPEARPVVLAEAISVAGFGPHPSLVMLQRLDLRTRIFVKGPPLSFGASGSPEVARLWAASAYQFLQDAFREVADARASGREPSVSPNELLAVNNLRPMLSAVFEAFAPDVLAPAQPLMGELASAAPAEAAATRATIHQFFGAYQQGAKAMLDVAERTSDPQLADALYRGAAYFAAADQADPRREQTARLIIGKIRNDRVRAIAFDEASLQAVRLAAEAGRWSEAASAVKKLSEQDLRLQVYGALARASATAKDQIAVELGDDSRRASKTSFRTTRVVVAMLWSSLAASSRKDTQGALAFASEALAAFDRLDPSTDNSDLKGKFSLDLGATLGECNVSPTTAPAVLDLPLAVAFTELAALDPIGLAGTAASVKTPARRVDALIALAEVFLAAKPEAQKSAEKTPVSKDG